MKHCFIVHMFVNKENWSVITTAIFSYRLTYNTECTSIKVVCILIKSKERET